MFATGETVSLAEWIIDDTCLVDAISGGVGLQLIVVDMKLKNCSWI